MYNTIWPKTKKNMLFKWIWKTSNRLRHKNFFWLLLHDRINIRNYLKRKNMQLDDYNCIQCRDNTEETLRQLFWDCNFAQECWNYIVPHRKLGISSFDDILILHSHLPKEFDLDIIIQGCWRIWTLRNGKIFRKEVPSINCWKFWVKEDLGLLQHRIKGKYFDKFKA